MTVDTQTLHGVDDLLAKLKSLPPEIVSKRGGPVKSGLRKGGVVIQRAAQEQIRAIVRKPESESHRYVSTDLLAQSVVVRRDAHPEQAGANERYRVLISRGRKFIYPATLHETTQIKTVMTARYLEFGTEQRPPTPWMLPAFMQSRQRALETVVTEISRGVELVIRRLDRAA